MMLIRKRKVLKIIDDEIKISENYRNSYLEHLKDPYCEEAKKIYFDHLADNYHNRIVTLLALKCRIRNEL